MLCLLGWIGLSVTMQYATATSFETRGGDWMEKFIEIESWLASAACAVFYGLWGYVFIMAGVWVKQPFGQRIFAFFGVIYLIWMAAVALEDFGSRGFLSQFFENFIVVLASAIVMAPLMLICALVTKLAGKR